MENLSFFVAVCSASCAAGCMRRVVEKLEKKYSKILSPIAKRKKGAFFSLLNDT